MSIGETLVGSHSVDEYGVPAAAIATRQWDPDPQNPVLEQSVGHLAADRKRQGDLTLERTGLSLATVVGASGDSRLTRKGPLDRRSSPN